MLVTKEYGSAVRINSVLTDMPLLVAEPVTMSQCGKCISCISACPAHASNGLEWNFRIHRDEFFNAFACGHTAKELCKKKIGIPETICGICIAVCPFTKNYIKKGKKIVN